MTFMNVTLRALAASLLPAIVFLTFTPNVIESNSQEITFTTSAIYVLWAAFLASSVVLAIFSSFSWRFLIFLTSLTINVLIWNAVYPHVWLHSPIQIAGFAVAEVVLLAFTAWLVFHLPFELVIRAGAIFAVLAIALSIPKHVTLLWSLPAPPSEQASPHGPDTAPPPNSQQFSGNVYHIVLDSFADPYLTKRLNEGSVDLAGYTYYPNATANYDHTFLSMRSVFTGGFHPTPITKWKTAFADGFTKSLRKEGIPMAFFPFYYYYCDPKAILCRSTIQFYSSYRKNIGITFAIDVAFQSMLPVSFRDFALGSLEHENRPTDTWEYGYSVTSAIRGLVEDGDDFPKWRQPIQSFTMDTLEDFLSTEERLPATGRYTYLHMMVPHPPFTFDHNCTFLPPDTQKSGTPAVEGQFACAVTVIKRITARLKELDRFDKSLIIFHGDHGLPLDGIFHQWDPTFARDPNVPIVDRYTGDISKMPSQEIESLAGALMLVHFPGQSGFQINQKDAQLIDIAPTILDYFGLRHSEYAGAPLRSDAPPRQGIYFESSGTTLENLKNLAKYIKSDGTWTFDSWVDVGATDENNPTQ